MHFLKNGQKNQAFVDPPPPLLIRAMPERKRFFFIDVFSNGHLQLQPWLEQHKRRCLSHPGLWSPPGSPRRPSCAKPLPTQVSDFEHDFVDLWPKMLGGSFPLLKAVTGQDRVTFHSRWALRLKPDEILRRGRCGVEERWLELEVGLEVAHFSLHATIQSNCILGWVDFRFASPISFIS